MGKKFKSGYTLTELSIAIVFISILLLTIAAVTINLGNMYRKGTTMKSINTIGLELIDEFSAAVSAATPINYYSLCSRFSDDEERKKCQDENGKLFMFQAEKTDEITKDSASIGSVQQYGIFCSGKYTYIWNTGYVLGQYSDSSPYSGGSVLGDGDEFRLRKFQDDDGKICTDNIDKDEYKIAAGIFNINKYTHQEMSDELITTKDIAIYDFEIDNPIVSADSPRGAIIIMHLVLGSIAGGVNINTNYAGCDTESASKMGTYEENRCAAFKFTFSAQAEG